MQESPNLMPKAQKSNQSAWSQFTLRRLLVNVTIFCTLLGIIAAFPNATLVLTLLLVQYAPALLIIAFACYQSDCRYRTLAFVCAGTLLGWILSPRMCVLWSSPPTFWGLFLLRFQTLGIGTAVGTFIAAAINWIVFGRQQRAN
ncbi:MAG: hypothetical protein H6822_00075 [Planctomycetaceae bacterium]|nr:hypothetical protein [Planctomycetales bacterium]MCB9920541.1 hypothetical protein [Planctomycetaceae bacterium]